MSCYIYCTSFKGNMTLILLSGYKILISLLYKVAPKFDQVVLCIDKYAVPGVIPSDWWSNNLPKLQFRLQKHTLWNWIITLITVTSMKQLCNSHWRQNLQTDWTTFSIYNLSLHSCVKKTTFYHSVFVFSPQRLLFTGVFIEHPKLGLEARGRCCLSSRTQAGIYCSELPGARLLHPHGQSLHYEII